jgi:hypothetical protein
MTSIYEEALADSAKLLEVAVNNAKNEVVEAVVPSIRKMVDDYVAGKVPNGLSAEAILEESLGGSDEIVSVPTQSVRKLAELVGISQGQLLESLELGSLRLAESAGKVDDTNKDKIQADLEAFYSRLEESKEQVSAKDFETIKNRLDSVKENIKETSMFETPITEEEEELDLDAEMDAELEDEPMDTEGDLEDLDAEDEEMEDEDLDFDLASVERALEQLGDALGLEVSVGDEEGEDEDLGDFELDDEELPLDSPEGEGEEELDLEMDDEVEEMGMYEGACEGCGKEDCEGCDSVSEVDEMAGDPVDESSCSEEEDMEEGETYEIAESELKREILRLRESRKGNNNKISSLTKELVEHKKMIKKLHRKLNESELFNAKLLHVNKLLHNKELTEAQKLKITESLDKAESLREVRLLYKSLTENQEKTNSTLTESVRRRRNIGSSSRTTMSGQPGGGAVLTENSSQKPSESNEINERWMVMAGIKPLKG